MARPKTTELTTRELEVMHTFWESGPLPILEVREQLARAGRNLAYTTVATLVRILVDKGFLRQINELRPFIYQPIREYEEVSRRLLGDLVERVFLGSREQLLVQLMEDKELSARQRTLLQEFLREKPS